MRNDLLADVVQAKMKALFFELLPALMNSELRNNFEGLEDKFDQIEKLEISTRKNGRCTIKITMGRMIRTYYIDRTPPSKLDLRTIRYKNFELVPNPEKEHEPASTQ